MFTRCFVVNLKRRPDRLEAFQRELAKVDWPFPTPEVVAAVDGKAVPVPQSFKGGQGAWGCLRSHSRILEEAIADNASVLILEDDAFFPSPETFKKDVEAFLSALPSDTEGIMLGGQHISGGPKQVKPGVVRCMNCQRTHAYGLKPGRWMRDLYSAWLTWHTHCDHKMGQMMTGYNVYATERFLIGQSDSRSDITCRNENKRIWSKPPSGLPCVLLRCPPEVREGLKDRLHFGYTIRDGIDAGLTDAFKQHDPRGRLSSWCELVGGEAWIAGKLLAVYHPAATLEALREVWKGPVVDVQAQTVQEALSQLPAVQAQPEAPIVLLRAGKAVSDALRAKGWHFGNWRSGQGLDVGLLELMTLGDPVPALAEWIETVGGEAQQHGAVLALRHPGLALAVVQKAAPGRKVLEIEAKNTEEALKSYASARNVDS